MPMMVDTLTETELTAELNAGRPDAQRALREAEQLLDTLPTILIGLSQSLRVTRWNQMASKVFGGAATLVCGKLLEDAGIHWDWDRVRRGISACREENVTIRVDDVSFVRTNGKDGMLGLTIHPLTRDGDVFLGFTIIGADITERKNLEKQLTQAQKLRSIGQLASGIAHEINTPTQYVGDNTRFLQDGFADLLVVLTQQACLLRAARSGPVSPEVIRAVDEAIRRADLDYLTSEIPLAISHTLEGVDRIAKIVRAMKEFAHPGREEKVAADLNKIIETTLTVARNEWKYVADLVTEFDRCLPEVTCHPGEINQVILNLVVNAAHAVEDQVKLGRITKGVITVATRRKDDWVEIQISDTGGGIPEEIRPRIFDPFFTTKEPGRGTGQGLAICHPVIVEKHGGRIFFESEVGRGTTFTINLPLERQAV
jgi:two-component system, NtrC family, sensor kinase